PSMPGGQARTSREIATAARCIAELEAASFAITPLAGSYRPRFGPPSPRSLRFFCRTDGLVRTFVPEERPHALIRRQYRLFVSKAPERNCTRSNRPIAISYVSTYLLTGEEKPKIGPSSVPSEAIRTERA